MYFPVCTASFLSLYNLNNLFMARRLKIAQYLQSDSPAHHPQTQPTNPFAKSRLERLVHQVQAASNIVKYYKNKDQRMPIKKNLSPKIATTHQFDEYETCSISPREKSSESRSHSNHKSHRMRRTVENLNVNKRIEEMKPKTFSKAEYKINKIVKVDEPKSQSLRYNGLERTLSSLQHKVQEIKTELVRHNTNKDFKAVHQKIQTPESSQNSEISNTETIVRSFQPLNLKPIKKSHPYEVNQSKRLNTTYYVSQILKSINKKHSVALKHVQLGIQCSKFMRGERKKHENAYKQRRLHLEKKQFYKNKKTLVFDLDQTLVHCNDKDYVDPDDVRLSIVFPTGQDVKATISIRPHALSLLQRLSQRFQLIVFAGGLRPYAKTVLDFIDPEGAIFQHRIYAQSCYEVPEGIIKDLRIINRSLSQMVLIDNSPFAYSLQPQNGIPILPYQDNQNDNQLKQLQDYLLKLQHATDVRQVNYRTFKLHRYADFDSPQQLISNLFMQHDTL